MHILPLPLPDDWSALSQDLETLYAHTVRRVQEEAKGKDLFPPILTIDRAFRLTHPDTLVGVVVGQDPYPQRGVATGLAFANKVDQHPLSPSLEVIKKSVFSLEPLEESKENLIFDPTLESWAAQGILLLNTALTVQENTPGSDVMLWTSFMATLIRSLSSIRRDLCWIFLGGDASVYSGCVIQGVQTFEYHPSYYARLGKPMPNRVWKILVSHAEYKGKELKLYGQKRKED